MYVFEFFCVLFISLISWSIALLESPTIKKIPFDELQIGECIGSGSFGRVYRGVWRGTPVAIKQLSIEGDSDQTFIADFVREISMMRCAQVQNLLTESPFFGSRSDGYCSDLRHPNIVQFLGTCFRLFSLSLCS
jgi:serine/threonine protein kinase